MGGISQLAEGDPWRREDLTQVDGEVCGQAGGGKNYGRRNILLMSWYWNAVSVNGSRRGIVPSLVVSVGRRIEKGVND